MEDSLPISKDRKQEKGMLFLISIFYLLSLPRTEWEASIFPGQHGDGDMVAIGHYCHTWVDTTMVRPNLNHPDDGGLCVWPIVCGVNVWLSVVIQSSTIVS